MLYFKVSVESRISRSLIQENADLVRAANESYLDIWNCSFLSGFGSICKAGPMHFKAKGFYCSMSEELKYCLF